MTAIERIQGFACEVDQDKWEELVRVADEVGCEVGGASRALKDDEDVFARLNSGGLCIGVYFDNPDATLIPYPDFLDKLKGEEKWDPKNGEEVEVKPLKGDWMKAKFVGMDDDYYVCEGRYEGVTYHGFKPPRIRQSLPTITRHEAEALLNKRIID